MLKRIAILLIGFTFIFGVGLHSFSVNANPQKVKKPAEEELTNTNTETPNLTKEQKETLSQLFKEKLANEREILDRLVEYGVLSKDLADKMFTHKKEWAKKLEQNGFVLPKHKGIAPPKKQAPSN